MISNSFKLVATMPESQDVRRLVLEDIDKATASRRADRVEKSRLFEPVFQDCFCDRRTYVQAKNFEQCHGHCNKSKVQGPKSAEAIRNQEEENESPRFPLLRN